MATSTPRYTSRQPASSQASRAARGASRKSDTRCEVKLRKTLWHRGLRYRKNVSELPGKPDIVFRRHRLVVFCDGDFWHGRDWEARKDKLSRGSNGDYWVQKIARNIVRDQAHTAELEDKGWSVLRFWETDIHRDPQAIAEQVEQALANLSSKDE